MNRLVNIVHGNDLGDEQLSRFAARDVRFTITPESELISGHGHPILGRLRQHKEYEIFRASKNDAWPALLRGFPPPCGGGLGGGSRHTGEIVAPQERYGIRLRDLRQLFEDLAI